MEISENGLKLLSEWEGEILHIYKDSAGLPTVGVGHLLTKEERVGGKYEGGITHEQAMQILTNDLRRFERTVNDGVKVALNQNQYDALVIFAFNIGDGGFLSSTALRKINAKEFDRVPDAMQMWNKAGGKIDDGLINRRKKEIKLFLEPV